MISIVLPVYNGERYLSESINSILSQTYDNFELIIVNDCSTDSSLEIVKTFEKKDSRIKIVNNEVNQKLPKSLNIGFSHCSGDYFTWTSDDNRFLPNALKRMKEELDYGNDFVFSMCNVINSEGNRIDTTEKYDDLNELLYRNIVLASFMYKKEVHDLLKGYDTSKFLVEDYDFWLRAYKKFRFKFIPEILYEIRFHDNNLGHTRKEDVNLMKANLLKENLSFAPNEDIRNSILQEISVCYENVARVYYDKLPSSGKWRRILNINTSKSLIKKMIGGH